MLLIWEERMKAEGPLRVLVRHSSKVYKSLMFDLNTQWRAAMFVLSSQVGSALFGEKRPVSFISSINLELCTASSWLCWHKSLQKNRFWTVCPMTYRAQKYLPVWDWKVGANLHQCLGQNDGLHWQTVYPAWSIYCTKWLNTCYRITVPVAEGTAGNETRLQPAKNLHYSHRRDEQPGWCTAKCHCGSCKICLENRQKGAIPPLSQAHMRTHTHTHKHTHVHSCQCDSCLWRQFYVE
jgi:ferredoxin